MDPANAASCRQVGARVARQAVRGLLNLCCVKCICPDERTMAHGWRWLERSISRGHDSGGDGVPRLCPARITRSWSGYLKAPQLLLSTGRRPGVGVFSGEVHVVTYCGRLANTAKSRPAACRLQGAKLRPRHGGAKDRCSAGEFVGCAGASGFGPINTTVAHKETPRSFIPPLNPPQYPANPSSRPSSATIPTAPTVSLTLPPLLFQLSLSYTPALSLQFGCLRATRPFPFPLPTPTLLSPCSRDGASQSSSP